MNDTQRRFRAFIRRVMKERPAGSAMGARDFGNILFLACAACVIMCCNQYTHSNSPAHTHTQKHAWFWGCCAWKSTSVELIVNLNQALKLADKSKDRQEESVCVCVWEREMAVRIYMLYVPGQSSWQLDLYASTTALAQRVLIACQYSLASSTYST